MNYKIKALYSALSLSGLKKEAEDILALDSRPTNLYIFDFDGTLFRSPMKPALWEGSWWGNVASLSPPCVPQTPSDDWWVSDTVSEARAAISDPSGLSIMMTGRTKREDMSSRVVELLSSAGLKFDAVILSDNPNTKAFKSAQISKLILENPTIKSVKIFDDRSSYLQEYSEIIKSINDEIKIDTTLVSAAAKPAECDEEAPREFETPQKSSAIVIKLTSESKGILFEKFPILYDNLGPEHIEVISKPNSQQLEQAKKSGLLGKEFQIKVTGYIKDEKGQLVTVEVPGAEFSEGLIPHILISTAKGVKQSYSKELAVGKVEPVNMQSLSGIMWWK